MLRRNYRRTRSDETDVRSAAGEELTGALSVSATGDGLPRDRGVLSSAAAAAIKCDGVRTAAGNGALAAGSRSAAAVAAATANTVVAAAAASAAARDATADDGGDGRGGAGVGGSGEDDVEDSPLSGRHRGRRRSRIRLTTTPGDSCLSTPYRHHNPSVGSADTEMTSLDARELWLPDTEPTPSTMSALHQFGAEMLRLSRGLEKVASPDSKPASPDRSRSVLNDTIRYSRYYLDPRFQTIASQRRR